MVWYEEFDGAFWLTMAGAIFGFGGVCLQAVLKSKCKEFHCCGLHCIRDISNTVDEDFDINLPAPPTIPKRVDKA